ncbi:hypothetical protein [Pseudomonas asiatica]|uniref:hypothetical protein n=1 Tax=Pseudomonas asiatica TaxID=2219225 RepID=UPI003C6DB8FA
MSETQVPGVSDTATPENTFNADAQWFLREMSSRKRALPLFASTAHKLAGDCDKDLLQFIEKHSPSIERNEDNSIKRYIVPNGYYTRHNKLKNMQSDFSIFAEALPKMTFVSIVSLFDAYLARTLRNIFKIRPEYLHQSGRSIKYSDLVAFGSFEAAQEYFLEKEIESVLRESHITQFDILEKRIGVTLTKLPAWQRFVELTERRNLLVHANGVVSAHYLETCEKFKVKLDKSVKHGSQLGVSAAYFKECCECVIEIGLKLNQVIWRKLLPDDLEKAEMSFISTAYDLLVSKQYSIAEKLLELSKEKNFAKVDGESSLLILVNLAIALKGQDKQDECNELLAKTDFSALSLKFKLSKSVLLEDYDEAKALMIKIGRHGDIRDEHYREWPLFRWFRKTEQFKTAYLEVYGVEYTVTEDVTEVKRDSDHEQPAENDEEATATSTWVAPEADEQTKEEETLLQTQ